MKCSLLSLSSYLDDELEAGKRGELEAHMVGCLRCSTGLGHLREEVERIGGLAPVHVPDHSARALMEQLGLLVPGEPLPPRSSPRAAAPVAPLPWLNGQAGKALPWRSSREALSDSTRPPRPTDRPETSSPVRNGRPSTGAPGPARPAGPLAAAARAPDPPLPGPAAPSPPPPVESSSVGSPQPPRAEPVAWPLPPAPTPPPQLPVTGPGLQASVVAPPDPPRRPSADELPGVPIPAPPSPPASTGAAPAPSASPASTPEDPVAAPRPAPAPAATSRPPAPPVTAQPLATAQSRAEPTPSPRPPELMASGQPVAAPAEPQGAPLDTGLGPFPAVGPAAEWPGDPVPTPRPGLMGRLRERWAVQRALARAGAEADQPVQITRDPDPARAQWELSSSRPAEPPAPSRLPAPAAERPARPQLGGRRESDELDAASARVSAIWNSRPPRSVDPGPASSGGGAAETEARPSPGRHSAPLLARHRSSSAAPGRAQPARPALGVRLRSWAANRALIVFAGCLALVVVVAIAMGHSASPLRSQVAQGPARQPALPPARAPAIPAAPVAPPPGTIAVALTDVHTLGGGASGAAIKGIRYGNHPGSFYRVVFDIDTSGLGSAGGDTPRATIGMKDPTTLWVVFDGVTASGAPARPQDGGTLSAVSQVQPAPSGKTIFELKLARPVTVSSEYLPSPLRLVLDLRS